MLWKTYCSASNELAKMIPDTASTENRASTSSDKSIVPSGVVEVTEPMEYLTVAAMLSVSLSVATCWSMTTLPWFSSTRILARGTDALTKDGVNKLAAESSMPTHVRLLESSKSVTVKQILRTTFSCTLVALF